MKGAHRFGKPAEVLTDQGRQYHTWRGRSEFRKLLDRKGIKHITSRPHHPQTVGKCERFWETVGVELWDRVCPRDLEDARDRLGHFIAHYNHFRPHQGIGGMVPADRFFGVESELRKVIEQALAENELRVALGEEPRTPLYMVGQVDGKPWALRGEAGKVVIQTPNGEVQEFNAERFGQVTPAPERQGGDHAKKSIDAGSTDGESIGSDGSTGDSAVRAGDSGAADGHGGIEARAPAAPIGQAAAGDAQGAAGAGQGALGAGNAGAEGPGAQDGLRADGVLAGSGKQEGGRREAGDAAGQGVAAVQPGALGYDRGAAQTTQGPEKGGDHDEPAGGSQGAS